MHKALVASSLVGAGVLAGVVITGTFSRTDTSHAAPTETPAPAAQAPVPGATDLTSAAERALRSVANISSTNIVRQPLYSDIFGREYYTQRQASSLGSGVLVSADGYVLTNAHVLRGGGSESDMPISVKVVLGDKRERDARVIGIDDATDLAVVKVEGTGLTPVAWGDSSKLRVAEWVMAIGNPFQLSQTVTMGIVSAVGRANLGIANYEDFIQTDAAINRGNSGGALINTRGELVGINTAIFSETGGYQGIGFAVPSNLARRVLDDLKQYGTVRRGSIGYVNFQSLTDEIAAQYTLPARRGVFVWEMHEADAAWQAGLRPGDVVVTFNGQPVSDPGQINRMVQDTPAGQTVRFGVRRLTRAGGVQELTIEVPVSAVQPQTGTRRRR